jgi:4-hydroxythreonine-4-phosphate dehydrogenase
VPFKTLSFGVVLIYSRIVRTSPDHGTDIAGKDMADYNSFKEAVYLAIDVAVDSISGNQ